MSAQPDIFAAKFGDWWNVEAVSERGTEWLYEHGPTDDYGFPQVNQSRPIEMLGGDARELFEALRADGLKVVTKDMAA